MKLHGIILPTSLAVSTPTIVPVGPFRDTVKLLIVIGMNLSTCPASRHRKPARCRDRNQLIAIIYTACKNCQYHISDDVSLTHLRSPISAQAPGRATAIRGPPPLRQLQLSDAELAKSTACRGHGRVAPQIDHDKADARVKLAPMPIGRVRRTFAANAVRLQLHALTYDLGNFMGTPAMPKTIGASVVSDGRYVTFQMAEVIC
jgi:hypothetical protein